MNMSGLAALRSSPSVIIVSRYEWFSRLGAHVPDLAASTVGEAQAQCCQMRELSVLHKCQVDKKWMELIYGLEKMNGNKYEWSN